MINYIINLQVKQIYLVFVGEETAKLTKKNKNPEIR